MNHLPLFKKTISIKIFYISFVCLFMLLVFTQAVKADGVFLEKKKDQHQLSGADLNRIKVEYQIRFGKKASRAYSYQSDNPWEQKKTQEQKKTGEQDAQASQQVWAQCRDYALHKRNRCYREGRDAYRCEQMYETRIGLCDSAP